MLEKTPQKKQKQFHKDDMIVSVESLTTKVSSIGTISPVHDFQAMLLRRDVDLVITAIDQMQRIIIKIIEDSIQNQFYQKAIECLMALRRGCVIEAESEKFNTFLRTIKSQYDAPGKKRQDFWEFIKLKKISLITQLESDESSVSETEAKLFLESAHVVVAPAPVKQKQTSSADDLLDMLE